MSKSYDIIIGRNMKHLRKNNDYSLQDIGNLLNVSLQQISKYEQGKNGLSAYRLIQIFNYLCVDPVDFLNIEANDSNTLSFEKVSKELVGQYEPPINSSDKDRDCSLSKAELL